MLGWKSRFTRFVIFLNFMCYPRLKSRKDRAVGATQLSSWERWRSIVVMRVSPDDRIARWVLGTMKTVTRTRTSMWGVPLVAAAAVATNCRAIVLTTPAASPTSHLSMTVAVRWKVRVTRSLGILWAMGRTRVTMKVKKVGSAVETAQTLKSMRASHLSDTTKRGSPTAVARCLLRLTAMRTKPLGTSTTYLNPPSRTTQ